MDKVLIKGRLVKETEKGLQVECDVVVHSVERRKPWFPKSLAKVAEYDEETGEITIAADREWYNNKLQPQLVQFDGKQSKKNQEEPQEQPEEPAA